MKPLIVTASGWGYRHIARPLFFRFDSEPIHDAFLEIGRSMSRIPFATEGIGALLRIQRTELETEVAGIRFGNPVGLAAGFDHEAMLPEMIGAIGFGFESVGTVTNKPYGGNPYPRIKRLAKSRAILVNKGFKSTGIDAVLARLQGARFRVPIGISLGRTNTLDHHTHEDAIADVVEAFEKTKASRVPFAYYELNISCPNLLTDISFYEPLRLEQLLTAIEHIELDKPLFIKMPIGLSDEKIAALLDVITHHRVAAVIFGNLQHDRTHPSFDAGEIAAFDGVRGNWSGMPCQERSDHLVKFAYTHTNGRLPIVGCGGIFNAEDAYRKVRNGASLVQLAASTIFEGPQIASEIAIGLTELLRRDGFAHVADAVGVDASR